MSDQKTIGCLDDRAIGQLLNDRLTADEQQVTEAHLGECETCQNRVELYVNDRNGWIDFKSQLSGLSCDETHDFAPSESTDIDTLNLRGLLAPTDDPSMLGRLGRYEICGVIGRGSMGLVFKALDPRLNRFVAIKLLADGYAATDSSRQRFEREGRAIAAVRDPHVIEIHGVEEFREVPYIVMQYIPGGSLQNHLEREGPVSTEAACRIVLQVAKGLEAAHRQGIVHRDIKPANILLEDGNQIAVVSDFGLARVADEVTMTRTGAIAGTPEFMSPEQASGQPLDVRSDLFSLGCVLYMLCTGCSPFRGETLMGVIHNVREESPRDIHELNPDVEPWLVTFTQKLLAKDRDERFQSAGEVVGILECELAHLQSPDSAQTPERGWYPSGRKKRESKNYFFVMRFAIGILILSGVMLLSYWLSMPRALQPNKWGIQPTQQEANFIAAKSAYDLAYETHLSEVSLRGDMAESLGRHRDALELGYDLPQSAYNMARAYAYQGNVDLAFEWLDKAVGYGFHDRESLVEEKDLRLVRKDIRYIRLLNRITDLFKKYQTAAQTYFGDLNYPAAERLYRELHDLCPRDEFSTMMIGASMLEQGKYDESVEWHQKTRNSVRFANFGSYNLACVEVHKGNYEEAFSYLNHSIDTGFTDVAHIKGDHQLETIKNMPEFEELISRMEKMNLDNQR